MVEFLENILKISPKDVFLYQIAKKEKMTMVYKKMAILLRRAYVKIIV